MAVTAPSQTMAEQAAPSLSPVGLYAAAAMVDVDRPLVYGVDVPVETLGGHGTWDEPCVPGDRSKHGGDTQTTLRFPGIGLWAADECSLVGRSEGESRAAAQRKLRATEGADAEVFAAATLAERAVEASSLPAAEAMFTVEGLTPVVHIRPSDVPVLLRSKLIYQASAGLRTVLGNVVAVGAGYEAALDGIYVTGPVTIYRNPVDTNTAVDVATNTRLTVAERAVAVTWLGQPVKVAGSPEGGA